MKFKKLNSKISKDSIRIAITNFDGIHLVPLSKIVSLKANTSSTIISLLNGNQLFTSKYLKDFETVLMEHQFVRIHQSYIVNAKFIKCYLNKDGGMVELTNETKLPISRRKKEELINYIQHNFLTI